MQINESNVTNICNKIITIFNKEKVPHEEIPVVLAQLLIYCGGSISNKDINWQTVNWEELERIYYSDNKDNDIGLGLVLNGGAIMQALNINIQRSGDATANKGNNNVQISTSTKTAQKNSSITTRSKTSKRVPRRTNG
jgi:hypothetical protein